MNNELKDWWGNPALDYGSDNELEKKYPDKIFVAVSKIPFGESYLLAVYEENEYNKAEEFLERYHEGMHLKGIRSYGAGISLGTELLSKRMENFQGSAL